MNTVPVTPSTPFTPHDYNASMQAYNRWIAVMLGTEATELATICACEVLKMYGKWTNQKVPLAEIQVPQEAVPTLILATVNMQLMAETRLLRMQHKETIS
jgi:hypothetical protein